MKRYPVKWTRVAEADLARIVEFIAVDAPINAMKVLDRLEALAKSLETLPTRGRVVPELARHGVVRYREVTSTPWRLINRVSNDAVLVVAVLDGRRKVEDVLFERLVDPSAD